MKIADVILVVCVTLTALQAGLFYAWSCSVMLGFARLADREFIATMRACNRAIQNPVFFATFFGAPLFLIVSTVLHYEQTARFGLLLAATVVFLVGTFGVTVIGNVPLNERLDRFEPDAANDEEVAAQRANFEARWNRLNMIRAATATAALILLLIAFLTRNTREL